MGVACNISHGCRPLVSQQKGQKTNACEPKHLVVVVVLTVCINDVFVDIIKQVHLIMGAVSLWTRPWALYLCTGP